MNSKEAIAKLKKDAAANPTLNAVLHSFAMRKRARDRITTKVLAKSMSREGFKYSLQEYEAALKALAGAGIGTVQLAQNGRIRALRDIRVTFRSLGLAVCGKDPVSLEGFRPRNRYLTVAAPQVLKKPPLPVRPLRISVSLGGDKRVDFDLPEGITPGEISDLLSRLSTPRTQ